MTDTRALTEDERTAMEAAWQMTTVHSSLYEDGFIAGLRYGDEAEPSEAEVEAAAQVLHERDGQVCKRAFETGEVIRWDDLGVVERKAWKTKARYVLIAARKASQ